MELYMIHTCRHEEKMADSLVSDYGGKRQGNRVVSLGEKPYYDPNSVSRRQALGLLD